MLNQSDRMGSTNGIDKKGRGKGLLAAALSAMMPEVESLTREGRERQKCCTRSARDVNREGNASMPRLEMEREREMEIVGGVEDEGIGSGSANGHLLAHFGQVYWRRVVGEESS